MDNLRRLYDRLTGTVKAPVHKSFDSVKVNNDVIYRNRHILDANRDRLQVSRSPTAKLLLELSHGSYSSLGSMLAADGMSGESAGKHEYRKYHQRSSDIAPCDVYDPDQKRMLHEVDKKGSGHIDEDAHILRTPSYDERRKDFRGLMMRSYAKHDTEISNLFASNGIRCHRTLAIVELREITCRNKKGEWQKVHIADLRRNPENYPDLLLSEEARELLQSEMPVIQVRGWGLKTRAEQLYHRYNNKDEVRRLVHGAIAHVRQEFPEVHDAHSYVTWFAETMGKNIGTMHGLGYVHRFLHDGNMTLDGSITDFDTVRHKRDYVVEQTRKRIAAGASSSLDIPELIGENDFLSQMQKDLNDARDSMARIVGYFVDAGLLERSGSEFSRGYGLESAQAAQTLEYAHRRALEETEQRLRDRKGAN